MAVASRATGVTRVEQIMGMPIVVDARDVDDAAALEPLFDWFRFVDRTFSTYIPESEISRLNRGELALGEAHPDVREVLARCDELRVETNGFFDVHAERDDYVDPSGLVKGWSVDRAAAIADELGWRNYAINAGGDIRLKRRRPPCASAGASGSSTRATAGRSPRSSPATTSPSLRRAPTRAAGMSSTRTPTAPRRACCR